MEKTTSPLPNFLIVGAAKSGTTSLYEYLRGHPDVFMPDWKEPAFFAPPEAGGVTTEKEYRKIFVGALGKKAIGEASVSYLYAPQAPQKIKNFLEPDVKIIVMLRNPVTMAYSLWGHQVREGFEDLPFAEAWAQESARLKNPAFARERLSWISDFAYRDRALYTTQIARYDSVFGPDRIKIFIFEEFYAPGLPLFPELCRFLGIADDYRPPVARHNQAGTVRSSLIRKVLREKFLLKDIGKSVLSEGLRKRLRAKLEKFNRVDAALPPLDPELRLKLQKEFADDVRRLEIRLNRSLKDIWFR